MSLRCGTSSGVPNLVDVDATMGAAMVAVRVDMIRYSSPYPEVVQSLLIPGQKAESRGQRFLSIADGLAVPCISFSALAVARSRNYNLVLKCVLELRGLTRSQYLKTPPAERYSEATGCVA